MDTDADGWAGLDGRECGEHRTTGQRAWCFDCTEWCYPEAACKGCELPALRLTAKMLADALRERMTPCDCCDQTPVYYRGDYDGMGEWACEKHFDDVLGRWIPKGRWRNKRIQELRGTPDDDAHAALALYDAGWGHNIRIVLGNVVIDKGATPDVGS